VDNKKKLHKEYGLLSNLKYVLKEQMEVDKTIILLIIISFVFGPFNNYMWNFVTKYIIDAITKDIEVNELVIIIATCVAISIFVNIMRTVYESESEWRYMPVRLNMIMKKNRKIMTLGYENLEKPEVLDCYQKAGGACSGNYNGIEGIMHKFADFVSLISVVGTGLFIIGSLSPVVMVLMFLLALVDFIIKNKTNKLTKKKIWDPMAPVWRKKSYMEYVTSDFEFAKDVRMYNVKDFLLSKYGKINDSVMEASKKNRNYWLLANELGNILWFLAQIVLYIWLIYSVFEKNITIGEFTLYLSSSFTFFTFVNYLFSCIGEMLQMSREVDDFRSFIDIEELLGMSKSDNLLEIPEYDKYEFTFEDVSFKYPNADKYALKNLNLTLKAGERLAVVGLNGAGKSTFIKLLLKLYEPTSGRILLNGVDIKNYDRDKYYELFAPVFQEVNLYAFPMAENISMKEPENTDKEKARDCANKAGLGDKVASLSMGIDTELLKVIFDDGVDLSGGEKQKLSLARALYKDAKIVVLDEPTAALDALAEAKMYEDFDKLVGGKTSVYISHRLSSTRFCNNVAMFEDGQMVEYGTHEFLLKENGAYANMFNLQAQYYVEEDENATEGGVSTNA